VVVPVKVSIPVILSKNPCNSILAGELKIILVVLVTGTEINFHPGNIPSVNIRQRKSGEKLDRCTVAA
jgi:hypothetical protein